MWRCGLLAFTACWTPAVSSAPTAAALQAPCVIRDGNNISTAAAATLMAGGIPFASLQHNFSRFDVVLEGKRARVHLETAEVELRSALRLQGFSLRTRRRLLHDGWLGIRVAFAREERQGVLDAGVPLPDGVDPRVFVATLPCTEVTFAAAAGYDGDAEADAENGVADEDAPETWLAFPPGTSTPLAKTPGGIALVHLRPTSAMALRVRVLERKGAFARVEISDRNMIKGWVPFEHAVRDEGIGGGGFGVGSSARKQHRARCTHDVPIYVATPTKVHHVGRYKAGAVIRYEGLAIGDPGITAADHAMHVDLGPGEIQPHVERADLASCTAAG